MEWGWSSSEARGRNHELRKGFEAMEGAIERSGGEERAALKGVGGNIQCIAIVSSSEHRVSIAGGEHEIPLVNSEL